MPAPSNEKRRPSRWPRPVRRPFLCLRLRFQLRLRFSAGSGRRNIARDPAEQALALLAVVESNRLAQHDLAPGREHGHVAPDVFKRDSRRRRDFRVELFTAVFEVFQDFLQIGYSLFSISGNRLHHETEPNVTAKSPDRSWILSPAPQ